MVPESPERKTNYRKILRNLVISSPNFEIEKGEIISIDLSTFTFRGNYGGEPFDFIVHGSDVKISIYDQRVEPDLENYLLEKLESVKECTLNNKTCDFTIPEAPVEAESNLQYLMGLCSLLKRESVVLKFIVGSRNYRLVVIKNGEVIVYRNNTKAVCSAHETNSALREFARLQDLNLSLRPLDLSGHYEYDRHFHIKMLRDQYKAKSAGVIEDLPPVYLPDLAFEDSLNEFMDLIDKTGEYAAVSTPSDLFKVLHTED